MQQCHRGAIGDLRSAVPDPDALGRRDPQERLPAPQDAALGALAVEHVDPLASASPSAVPQPGPGGLVAVDEQLAHGAAFRLPALFAVFNHHDDRERPNRQPPAG